MYPTPQGWHEHLSLNMNVCTNAYTMWTNQCHRSLDKSRLYIPPTRIYANWLLLKSYEVSRKTLYAPIWIWVQQTREMGKLLPILLHRLWSECLCVRSCVWPYMEVLPLPPPQNALPPSLERPHCRQVVDSLLTSKWCFLQGTHGHGYQAAYYWHWGHFTAPSTTPALVVFSYHLHWRTLNWDPSLLNTCWLLRSCSHFLKSSKTILCHYGMTSSKGCGIPTLFPTPSPRLQLVYDCSSALHLNFLALCSRYELRLTWLSQIFFLEPGKLQKTKHHLLNP